MKRLSFLYPATLMLCIICSVTYAEPTPKPFIHFETWETSTGSKVYYAPITSIPIVDIKIAFSAGSVYDAKTPGLASITNSLLFEGADTMDASTIAKKLESVGAEYAVSTLRDGATIHLRTLSKKAAYRAATDVLTTVLSKPSFSEKAFNRIQSQTKAALRMQQQKAGKIASNAMMKALYGEHPYAHPVVGNAESIGALTPADAKKFHNTYYNASNAVIVIVGDLSKRQAKSFANKLIASLPEGEHAPLPPALLEAKVKASVKTIAFPAKQSTILVGKLGIARDDADYIPLQVGNYTLGGGMLTSRLAVEVREKRGLSYSVYSLWRTLQRTGPVLISLQTKKSQTQKALSVTRDVLATFVATGPTPAELAAAKQYMTGSFPLKVDSNKDIAEHLLLLGFYNLPNDYYDTYIARINAVTADAIKAAYQRHLDPKALQTIIVGPK